MKLFLLIAVVAPIVDFFANNGHFIDLALSKLASAGHAIANVGATLMPSMG